VDVDPSGTRKKRSCWTATSWRFVWKLRRVLHALDQQQAIELLLDKMKQTKSQRGVLMADRQTTPGGNND